MEDRLTVLDHPLASALLGRLRDIQTGHAEFRELARRLGLLLAVEATRDLPTVEEAVDTPVGRARVDRLSRAPVAVAVLRAGLGLLAAVTDLFPAAPVGFIGLERDHTTLEPREYYRKIPDARGAHGLVLEPMLATGGSATAAVSALIGAGAGAATVVSVVAAPEGLRRLAEEHPAARVVAAAVDAGLDERGYIVPGLGDFGDRLLGTPP